MAATCRGVSPLRFLLTGREGAAEQLGGVGGGVEDSLLSIDEGPEEPEVDNCNTESILFVKTYNVKIEKEDVHFNGSSSEPYHHWKVTPLMSQRHPSSAGGELADTL